MHSGVTATDGAAVRFTRISEMVQEMASSSQSVAHAARQQADSIDQVGAGLEQVENVTQNNSAAAEEIAAATQELAAAATQLDSYISSFHTDEVHIEEPDMELSSEEAEIAERLVMAE